MEQQSSHEVTSADPGEPGWAQPIADALAALAEVAAAAAAITATPGDGRERYALAPD